MSLPLLWEHCIAAYLKDVFVSHSNSAHTVRDYAGTLRRFFERSAKSPEQYTREDVIDFLAMPTPRGTPPSHSTRNVRLIIVRGFYRFATHYTAYDGYGKPYKLYQGDNPAEGLHGMKIEVRPRYLTEDEVLRFFAAIPRDTLRGLRDRALFLTYFLTARRLSEIANLLTSASVMARSCAWQKSMQSWRASRSTSAMCISGGIHRQSTGSTRASLFSR